MSEVQDQSAELAAKKAAILNETKAVPSGATMVEFNPMETIPTLAIGEDIVEGQSINARYVRTDVRASVKFVHSKTRNADGVPTQLLHIFRSTSGNLFGIWSTGELKNVCEKLQPEELVSLTYKGKGQNAKGQQQHFFDYKRQQVAAN